MEIVTSILNHPTTSYFIGFGTLGAVLAYALHKAKELFALSDRALGVLTVLVGAAGGMCIQGTGLVILPGGTPAAKLTAAAFVGVVSAFAAAGCSQVDLRDIFKKKETP